MTTTLTDAQLHKLAVFLQEQIGMEDAYDPVSIFEVTLRFVAGRPLSPDDAEIIRNALGEGQKAPILHSAVWYAIDTLAKRHGMSPSGLAIRAGFDACSFNPSKRIDQFGKPRWPNLSTVAKVLEVTGETLNSFAALVDEAREAAQ